MILSASRRTDIPHYYADWLLRRLKAGEVIARNPMNPRQLSRIFLSPQEIDCIVFWTKDPRNLMERLDEVDRLGYRYYFQFTLTPYPPDIEPGLPDKAALMDAFVQLSRRIGRERVVWRYDPIIVNQAFPIEWHCQQFSLYCQRLAPHTRGMRHQLSGQLRQAQTSLPLGRLPSHSPLGNGGACRQICQDRTAVRSAHQGLL